MFATWRSERFSIGGREVSVRVFPSALVVPEFVDEWLNLERRAIEGNMFLSPHFILPALNYLTRKRGLLLAIFRNDGDCDKLIGLGAFIARPPTVSFPLPYLEAYQCRYTYLTGILLDRDYRWLALEALGTYLSLPKVHWCGLKFQHRLAESALDQIYQDQAITASVSWSEYRRQSRPILLPESAAEIHDSLIARNTLGNDLHDKRTRLEALGRVESRVLLGKNVTSETVETFLRLQDAEVDFATGTSMLAQPHHAEFFRDMTRRFALDGRALFCELLLDGRVVASTSNYISGRLGFSFGTGSDPEFVSLDTALLNELELMRWIGDGRLDIDYLDGGGAEGADVQQLWKSRRDVVSGIFVGGNVGNAILPVLSAARDVKRAMLG